MSSLGRYATADFFEGDQLKVDNIIEPKTSDRIYFTEGGSNLYSIGEDPITRDWSFRHEVLDVTSFSVDINTGVVSFPSGTTKKLVDLFDVDITNLANNTILYYDSSVQKFKFKDESVGASNLVDLNDVDITNLADQTTLYYDSSTSNFKFSDTLKIDEGNSNVNVDAKITFSNDVVLESDVFTEGNIRIGHSAGNGILSGVIPASSNAICLGNSAGANSGLNCINIGKLTGALNQGDESIAIGDSAGQTSQGIDSIALGHASGQTRQGIESIAMGKNSGNNNQGTLCLAVGNNAGQSYQGQESTAIGQNAGQTSQGVGSVALGSRAGRTNQGESCVAIGERSGQTSQGADSISIGARSGELLQGANSLCVGHFAGFLNQGIDSLALGHYAGQNYQGTDSLALGHNAGQYYQGADSLALGHNAGQTSQGTENIAIGHFAGQSNQGNQSIAVGVNSGLNDQGINAIAVGYEAGKILQTDDTVAIGTLAGYSSQGLSAIAMGAVSGQYNQGLSAIAIGTSAGTEYQGTNTVAIGRDAGKTSQGADSLALGHNAGSNSQGSDSIAIGHFAGHISQGNNAVAVGRSAGSNLQGIDCVALGGFAGHISQEYGSIAIGFSAGRDSLGSNTIAIGNQTATVGYSYTNCILLNASGSTLFPQRSGAFYVSNITDQLSSQILQYNTTTKEITHSNTIGITGFINCGNLNADQVNIYNDVTQQLNFYDTQGGVTTDASRIESNKNGGGSDLIFYTRRNGSLFPEVMRIDIDGYFYVKNIRLNTASQILTYDSPTGEVTRSNNINITGTITSSDITCNDIRVNNSIHGTAGIIDLFPNDTNTNSVAFLQLRPAQTSLGGSYIDFWTNSTTGGVGNLAMTIAANKNVQFYGNNLTLPGAVVTSPNSVQCEILSNLGSGSHRGHLLLNNDNARLLMFDSNYTIKSMVQCYSDGNIYTIGNMYYNGILTSSASMGTSQFEFKAANVGQRATIACIYDHIQLYSLSYKNIFHWAPFQNVSDDRLKWEETPLTDGLDVIMTLKPVSYWKGQTIDVEPTEEERRWEIGFIAQEVDKIPQLKHCVKYNESTPDHPERAAWTLNYGEIHNYHIAATQELYKKLQELTDTVSVLTDRIAVLESN